MEAVVVSDVFGTRAGAYMATLLLCRDLARTGIEITCFTTWVEPGHPVSNEEFIVVEPLVRRGYRWDWPNRMLAAQVIRHVKKRNPALIIVVGITRVSRYLLASSIANRLMVWELTNGCGNKFVDNLAIAYLSGCKAMLSPSSTIDRSIRSYYGFEGDILRLPFWVEDQNLQFMPRPVEFVADFIYLGRRDEEKGLRELVQATAMIARDHDDVRVVIGGFGDERSFVAIAKDLNVEKNISFRTFISRKEVMEALAHSRCLVLPSYHEGYPLVLLEAAQCSLPFIATNVGSIPEVFQGSKACILIEPRDAKSLARAMEQMLEDPADCYVEKRKAAYEMFSHLSSSKKVTEYLNVILAQLDIARGAAR
jgi:glycosyltransferase involved in cell wall biosynthesis